MFIRNFKPLIKYCISASIVMAISQSVSAGTTSDVISFQDKTPDSNELLNAFILKKSSGTNMERQIAQESSLKPKLLTRGISLKKKTPVANDDKIITNVSKELGKNTCQAGSHSVAININFKSNSRKVNQSDNALLQNIAKAMNSPQLSQCYFVVEGHTDAKGNDYYNLWLSQERASEVKAYLKQYKINERRLVVVGKGESQLRNRDNPLSAENRRVEFRVINSVN